jgi:hypothetical protein
MTSRKVLQESVDQQVFKRLKVVQIGKDSLEAQFSEGEDVLVTISLSVAQTFTINEIAKFLEERKEEPADLLGDDLHEEPGLLVVSSNVLERMAFFDLVANIQSDTDKNGYICDSLYAYCMNFNATKVEALKVLRKGDGGLQRSVPPEPILRG